MPGIAEGFRGSDKRQPSEAGGRHNAKKPRTQREDRRKLERVEAFLGRHRDVRSLSDSDVERYKQARLRGGCGGKPVRVRDRHNLAIPGSEERTIFALLEKPPTSHFSRSLALGDQVACALTSLVLP